MNSQQLADIVPVLPCEVDDVFQLDLGAAVIVAARGGYYVYIGAHHLYRMLVLSSSELPELTRNHTKSSVNQRGRG